MSAPPADFLHRLNSVAAATEAMLLARLGDGPTQPARLMAAMRHAATGGKRIRPFLVVESAALFDVKEGIAAPAAAAFECVHCYSLIHDDLPALDNDDLRRGKPTLHVAFDEATAILAGDALLTLAFEMLGEIKADAETRITLVLLLARAAGLDGMVGGQMLDLAAEGRFAGDRRPLSLAISDVERLQGMKTGALLVAACEAGAILGRATDAEREALGKFARALGLAFQISDDLLDAEGDPASLGKAAAKDAKQGKATLVALHGIAGARERLTALVAEAEGALAPFGERADMLNACARYVAERNS